MFLLRSAFWLTVAYLAIGPQSVDFGAAANDLTAHAVATSHRMVTDAILDTECDNVACAGGKAVVAAALTSITPSSVPSMHETPREPVPFPRPRPDWMG